MSETSYERNIVLLKGGFINLEAQGSSIFNNNVYEKAMNHLQSTRMERILSKPTFAGAIPEASPQPTPLSPPSAHP